MEPFPWNSAAVACPCMVMPCRRSDVVTVRTGILEMRERVIRFYHEMRNDETGEIAATVVITGVHMDTQARAACPFPEEVVERGRKMIVDSNPVT